MRAPRFGILTAGLGLLLLTAAFGAVATAESKTVTVTGQGETKEAAIRDGQRRAAESVYVKVYSDSTVKDFVLVKDTILTRSAGLIESFKEISVSETDDGIFEVKMEVVVSLNKIKDMWGVVTNLLKQMGRPKIMVAIREKIDGKFQDMSTVQTRVENLLLKNGFLLVDESQLKAIDKKDLQAAVAEDKPEKVQAIAKRFGAQLFITGVAQASTAGARDVYGRTIHKYQGDANVKTFRTDTAQLLSSIPGAATAGAQQTPAAAAKQALDAQGQQLAPAITRDILQFWMDVLAGRGEVKLEVSGVTFKDVVKIKKAIKAIKGVSDVQSKFANENADISIESEMSANTLAEKMVEDLDEILDISDVSQNVIKAKYKKPD